MKFGQGFQRFMMELLRRDKHAAPPTRREFKRITEKAARKRGVRTFGLESRSHVAIVRHFGTFRPLRPFSH